jgi:hypothetical protein
MNYWSSVAVGENFPIAFLGFVQFLEGNENASNV